MLAYLRASLGGAAEAEDLAADTFLRAWREWPRFRVTERPVHHWLLRIAHNLVIDRARRQGRRGVVPLAELGRAGTDVGEEVADRLQLLAAVGSLAPAEREVLALRAAGLPYADVAAAFHLPLIALATRTIYGEDRLADIPAIPDYLGMMRERPHVAELEARRREHMPQFIAAVRKRYGLV